MSEAIGTGVAGGPAPPRELRLAVAMRGGVSLAVWMGGACQEIEELRRAAETGPAEDGDGPADVYRTLLGHAGYDEVVVDVLAGTSAGGLNAVLLSCALLYDMPFGEPIRDLWLQVADIMRLSRPANDRNPPSLLQGDTGFYQDLMVNLGDLLEQQLEPPAPVLEETRKRLEGLRRRRRVDLLLTCTLLHPASETFHQPVGDPITDARSRAYFRFRNLEQGAVSDFDPFEKGPGGRKDPWEPVRRLAYAARSTASYPAAFEPATIWAASGDDHSRPGRGSQPFPRNLHGVFSETPAVPQTERPAHVIDGGVLDNIPVAWAVRSIAAAKANRSVDRWLLYLQPEPPIAPVPLQQQKRDDRGLLRLVPVAVKAHGIKLGSESLLEDVEELRRYEAAAGQRRQVAETLATTPLDLTALLDKAGRALDDLAESGYRRRQARVEAARLARLLETPVEVTGPDPLPFGGVRDPLADIDKAVRAALLAQLAGPADRGLQALVLPEDVTGDDLGRLHLRLRSLQAVARAVAMLLDCARVLERQGLRVPSDGGGDRRAGQLAEDELFPLRFAVEMVVGAHDRLLLRRCAEIAKGASARPDEMARDAAAALRRAAEETGVTTAPVDVGRLKKLCEHVTVDELSSAAGWPEDGYGWLWEPLRREAERLAKAIPEDGLAYAYLRDAADRQPPEVLRTLLATEVLFGPVRPDPLSENASIRFHMISAANQSPLYPAIFDKDPATITAKDKLVGNQLNNFGAFLSARWRQNDWTWGRLDAATSLIRLLTRPERISDDTLAALVTNLGGDGAGSSREQLIEQVIRRRHERILDTELRILAGLDDDPPAGRPIPADEAPPTLLAKVGGQTVQDLLEPRRRQVIGRISRLLWRSLKPRGNWILRALITITTPLGVPLVRFALRRFVKLSSQPRR
jgi:patatin-related protein